MTILKHNQDFFSQTERGNKIFPLLIWSGSFICDRDSKRFTAFIDCSMK